MPETTSQEKLEFLRREDVRTMAKDIARLREEEAQKERERIAQLKLLKEEEAKKEREGIAQQKIQAELDQERKMIEKIRAAALARVALEERKKTATIEKIRDSLIPPEAEGKPIVLPRPLTRLEKFLIRIILIEIVLLVAFLLLTFAYWYLVVKGGHFLPRSFPTIPLNGDEIKN